MGKVRQVTVLHDASGTAVLPKQPKPFRLHSVCFLLSVSLDTLAYLEIVYGGVADCMQIPAPCLDASMAGAWLTWMRGGAFFQSDDQATNYQMVIPLPSDLVLDSQFTVAVELSQFDPLNDSMSEVSFLIEDVD